MGEADTCGHVRGEALEALHRSFGVHELAVAFGNVAEFRAGRVVDAELVAAHDVGPL